MRQTYANFAALARVSKIEQLLASKPDYISKVMAWAIGHRRLGDF
jgi:hypothetical protein